MNNLESYLIKRVLPYDRRVKELSHSINTKETELGVLKNSYHGLLRELEDLVGPAKFAKYLQKVSMTPDEQDLTDEEMLILLKLFDFAIPLPDADYETTEKVLNLKTLIQESDFRSLMTNPMLKSLVRSPEFYMLINNKNFRDLMGQEKLLSLVRTSEFKELLYNPNFHSILARNGLVLPLKPFDLQMPFSISILKSIARLERIFEDFRVNRCAEYAPMEITKPVRSSLVRSLSPRKSGLSKSPTVESLVIFRPKTPIGNNSSLNLAKKLNKTGSY